MKQRRILMDGLYFGDADSLGQMAEIIQSEDPAFDPARLSYDPEDAKRRAKLLARNIAAQAKSEVKTEVDIDDMALAKMFISIILVLATDRSKFDQFVSPALLAILTSEADAEGSGKTAIELVKENINHLVYMANVSAKVDGNNASLLNEIENASVDQLDQIIDNGRQRQQSAVKDTLPETVLS